MPLPEVIPAKVSSEAAGYISFTPVEKHNIALVDLVEQILAVTGKDMPRVGQILHRGSFVSGSSRYRWEPLEPEESDLLRLLDRFPDPRPDRSFDLTKCRLVVLRAERGHVELPHEVASQRRLLRRESFWDVLVPKLVSHSPSYSRYSYGERADVYAVQLPLETVRFLQEQTRLLKYSTVTRRLQALAIDSAELFVTR